MAHFITLLYSSVISEEVTQEIWSQEVHPLPLIDQLFQIPLMDDLSDKLPDRSIDKLYWQGFELLRLRLIKDFNEKEYIQKN